ncbi:MAG TPA: type II toxin-antitoxin system Phd/YefM family antitoxin [Polyangiales bacterium]|nr:type II toxin-antitoxin system Phd/YefM family antitoxin [Polyangiales bacterium]
MDNSSSTPPPVTYDTVSATEAKNSFGMVLDKAIARGGVVITKHDEVRAVLLSRERYEALLANQQDPLADLSEEFDALVERMQAPKARTAGRALFKATGAELGRAAVARRKKRG